MMVLSRISRDYKRDSRFFFILFWSEFHSFEIKKKKCIIGIHCNRGNRIRDFIIIFFCNVRQNERRDF